MADSQRKTANLFDKDNADTQNIYVYTDDTIVHDNQNTVSVVFPCQSSTTYTISKTISSRFAVGYTESYPQNGTRAYSVNADNTATTLSITTGSDAEYIVIFIAYTPQETKTTQEILNSIMINEGQTALPYEPYGWVHSLRKLTTATADIEPTIYTDGTAITAYTLKGNTVQDGTPTPSAPISVNGVGNKTANLFNTFDIVGQVPSTGNGALVSYNGSTTSFIPISSGNVVVAKPNGILIYLMLYAANGDYIGYDIANAGTTINGSNISGYENARLARLRIDRTSGLDDIQIMLNSGSTAKPYEPYGYKIPISNGQQTIDIYIGDLPLLKSLDGTAVDEISNGTLTRRVDSDGSVLPAPITTQITMPSIPTTEGANSITVDTTVQPSEFTATWTGWHDSSVKEYDGTNWQ